MLWSLTCRYSWLCGSSACLSYSCVIVDVLPDDAGHYHQGRVGVIKDDLVVHVAQPVNRVSELMRDLL